MRIVAAAIVLLAGGAGVGCNAPPKDPPRDTAEVKVVDAAAPPSAAPVASASAAPAPPKACTSDGECRTYASYCTEAPCACRALSKEDGDPKCLGSGPKVSCFVNPCMKKTARCQSGACVLTAQGAAAATEK